MKKHIFSALLMLCCMVASAQNAIDLSGKWEFQIDRNNKYLPTSVFTDQIDLPGSMVTRCKGDLFSEKTQLTGSLYDSSFYFNPYMEKYRVEGQMKYPFFLTTERHYTGNAWYRRIVNVPKTWAKQTVLLTLERPHIETTIYINGKEVGHQMGLSAPHVYDVTPYIVAGQQNTIAIKVYNGIENVCVGQDSHSVTDQTQGNWNGIAGRMSLEVKPLTYVSHVDVYPYMRNRSIDVIVRYANNAKKPKDISKKLRFEIDGSPRKAVPLCDSVFTIRMGDDAKLWDEHNPNVYHLAVINGTQRYETVFGMRDIEVKGPNILINKQVLYVRGTVENCCSPETGYPPTDVESWRRVIAKCKEYGLNTMRFHSYCPPEAAFVAADELGFYLQPEGPSWPNHGVKLRRGQYIDTYLMDETRRIVEAYGNHPSFVMLSAGNEPAGDWVSWCNDWVKYWVAKDERRIYCGANVGGGWAWDSESQYHVKGGARGLDWDKVAPHSDDDYYQDIRFPRNYKGTEPNTDPFISHEQGQWCAFPDLKERDQYTGAYKAKNFDIFEDLLKSNGMGEMAEKFLMASGKLQTLCYKYEMERNFRTKDYAGFVLLGLNDYSGQGSALVGPLNVHWREKGYVDAKQWTEFCNEVVPLARFPKFVYTNNETLTVPVELYNASSQKLLGAHSTYTITDETGALVKKGRISLLDIAPGKNHELGTIKEKLGDFTSARKLTLTVEVTTARKSWHNHWDFWVYPETMEMPELGDIYVTDTLDAKAIGTLRDGGKVLFTAAGKVKYGSDINQTYMPVFWNTSWFKMRPPHTTGAYIAKDHAMYADFPTDDWTNLNWWELVNRAQVMNLAEFPSSYQSPMQPIDTWHVSRKCGMVVEANVLSGKVFMTTMDISSDLDHRVVARQMRASIINYMKSDKFQPTIRVDIDAINNLYKKQARPVDMFTNDSPDELKPKIN